MNGDEAMMLKKWANFLYMLTHSMREELCPECMAKFDVRTGHLIRINEKMYRESRKPSLAWGGSDQA